MRFIAVRTPGRGATSYVNLATALFFPTTEALSTVGIKRVRFTTWVDGEDIQTWPAIQYSDDGSNWATFPVGVPSVYVGPGYSNTKYADSVWQPIAWVEPTDPCEPTEDRQIQTDWFDCPGDFQDIAQSGGSPTYLSHDRLFCRFGQVALNATPDSSETPPRGGRVALQIEYAHVTGGTLLGGPALCPSGGGNGTTPTSVFTPLTGALATADLGQVRSTLETQATDAVEVSLGYQTSDDGENWSGTVTALPGSPTRTADGISYPEAWTSFTVTTARYVRIGVVVANDENTDQNIRGVVANIRVDWREG